MAMERVRSRYTGQTFEWVICITTRNLILMDFRTKISRRSIQDQDSYQWCVQIRLFMYFSTCLNNGAG